MADKCDDASGTLDLPDLNFLISATTSQVVFDGAIGVYYICAASNFLAFLLFVGVVRGVSSSFFALAFRLELLLHLLNALFGGHSRRCVGPPIGIDAGAICRGRCSFIIFSFGLLFCFFCRVTILLISALVFGGATTRIVGGFDCAARLGRRPHDAVDDVLVVGEHLHDCVIIIHTAATATSLCTLLLN